MVNAGQGPRRAGTTSSPRRVTMGGPWTEAVTTTTPG